MREQAAALRRVVELGEGRLDAAGIEAARRVLDRAGARATIDIETTVVALAGPTGAGKSTLFNTLAGRELATVSVRRPTTGAVAAAIWGEPAPELLDWLGVVTRHVLGPADRPLVLLDLPDYDSVEQSHRSEAERVIEVADLLVWVTDPQKYADSALHDRYLRSLATHAQVMLAVLSQADRLAPAALEACRSDFRRLLAQDGLPGVEVIAVSATTGAGLPELRAKLDARVQARGAAAARLRADVARAAMALAPGCGDGAAGDVERGRAALEGALADAAGVPVITGAVARAHRRAGSLAAGWPPARWLGRLRADPLRRLRLGDAATRTSLPRATPVQEAAVASATRTLAQHAGGELPEPWPGLVRRAATSGERELPDLLDRAVAGVDVTPRRPRWWTLAGILQKALVVAAAAGLIWLAAVAGLGFLHLEDAFPLPEVEGVPVPTALLATGAVGGLLLALLARYLTALGARRRARRAGRRLREAIAKVADEHVVEPVSQELEVRRQLCAAIAAAMPEHRPGARSRGTDVPAPR